MEFLTRIKVKIRKNFQSSKVSGQWSSRIPKRNRFSFSDPASLFRSFQWRIKESVQWSEAPGLKLRTGAMGVLPRSTFSHWWMLFLIEEMFFITVPLIYGRWNTWRCAKPFDELIGQAKSIPLRFLFLILFLFFLSLKDRLKIAVDAEISTKLLPIYQWRRSSGYSFALVGDETTNSRLKRYRLFSTALSLIDWMVIAHVVNERLLLWNDVNHHAWFPLRTATKIS